MTLFSDGTCSGAVTGDTWALKEGKLVFIATTKDGAVVGAYDYIFPNDTTLALTDVNTGGSKVYSKQ